MTQRTLIITRHDVERLVERFGLHFLMDRMIDALRAALETAPEWRDDLPARDGFSYTEPQVGLLEWMPYMNAEECRATIKLVSYTPSNPAKHDLPTIVGNIASYDLRTGHLVALADGVFLTALRTGAASAVASAVLARSASKVIGVIGAGAQAVTQIHALSRVFDLERVLAYDVEWTRAESLAARVAFTGLAVEAVPLRVVEQESDIVCTATSVGLWQGPVLTGDELQPHVHINAIGSDLPGKFELPLSVLERSLVCPDFTAQAKREGECQRLETGIGPDLRTLVQNPGEYGDWQSRPTVFDSTGFAFEDHVAISMLGELAREHGLGTEVEIEHLSKDVFNPYDFSGEGMAGAVAARATAVGGVPR